MTVFLTSYGVTLDADADGTYNLPIGVMLTTESDTPAEGRWFRFDFGTAINVTGFICRQSDDTARGDWLWQGSADGATWTDIGTIVGMGGAAMREYNLANAASYRYYRLINTDGAYGATGHIQNFYFKGPNPRI